MKRRDFLKNNMGIGIILPSLKHLSSYSEYEVTTDYMDPGEVLEEFEKRRDLLLRNTAGNDISPHALLDTSQDLYSNRAIANLVLKRNIKEANERIRHTANWFEHPHPKGAHINGESDFAAIKLCRAIYLFRDKNELEDDTKRLIEKFFLTQNFKSIHPSENHELMFVTSRYLMAQMFPDKLFSAYNKVGSLLLEEDIQWLKDFIRYRAKRGWGEFDSPVYLATDMEILLTLYDYTEDQEMKRLTRMMLDFILADVAIDSLNGMHCGAHGRIYTNTAFDHATESLMPFQYLYFGVGAIHMTERGTFVDSLVSGYSPSKLLIDIALNRDKEYENFERKHLHNTSDIKPENPLEGSIRKYTFYNPQFVMGCVQSQDHYPEDSPGKWYAYHQQHNWDLSFATSSRSKIFTHHPGNDEMHNYWTGDLRCGCGHFFQHKRAIVCLYDISKDQVYHFIHAYLPRKEFDEIIERKEFIFVKSGDSYAALKLLGESYEWTTAGRWRDKEVISHGRRNGAICEVGEQEKFGSFENFCTQILANRIDFDRERMTLSYHSQQNGKLTINTQGLRLRNDQPVDLDYPLFRSPYMESAWDSGLVVIKKGDKKLTLNFC